MKECVEQQKRDSLAVDQPDKTILDKQQSEDKWVPPPYVIWVGNTAMCTFLSEKMMCTWVKWVFCGPI